MTQRRSKKAALQSQARYDAAGMGRRIKSWNPPSTGPQRAVEGLERMRDRARDTTRNDWAGESGVQKWTTNLIGVGVTPRWKNKAHAEIWKTWVPEADADGVLDAYGLQTLATRSWLASGEVFVRRRPRRDGSPLSQPVQVQLIESDFVPLFDTDQWEGLPAGNTIRQGIERNKYGRRTAYWMYRDHPGDRSMGHTPTKAELIRVAASEISHVFEPSRPGQLRGVSMLAPILVKLRSSMDFEDAVLDRQKLANLFMAFIKREMPKDWADIEFDPDTGLPKFYDKNGNILASLEPGTTQELNPGESVEFANPPDAGTSYTDYMRTTHLGTAAGQGLPYETFSGDIRDVSDRTLRIVINEFRRFARQRQWQIIIPSICRPMVTWLGQAALLTGAISPAQAAEFMAPTWAPEGWEYIHPVQDVEGKIKARDAKFISTSQIISERGDDPEEVRQQIKADERSGLGPQPEPAPAAPGATPPARPQPSALEDAVAGLVALQARAPAASQQPAPSGVESALLSMLQVMQEQTQATQSAVLALARALADRDVNVHVPQQPAPVVENHLTLPQQPAPVVENHLTVQPTPVDVHVAAPTVENVINVEPAKVEVELPDRQITSVIERDPKTGDITNVTQTETTLQ